MASSLEQDASSFSDVDDDDIDLDSSLNDGEAVPKEVETAPAIRTEPKYIGFGRPFVFTSIFIAGVVVSAISFVALNKVVVDSYDKQVKTKTLMAMIPLLTRKLATDISYFYLDLLLVYFCR